MTEYVAGFLFNQLRDKVLLIQKHRPRWQAGMLNAIGGKMEPGETALEAMVREFGEEVTFPSGEYDWKHRVTLTGPNWRVFFFAAFAQHSLTECSERTDEFLVINNIYDLEARVIPNLRWLIPLCLDRDIGSASVIDLTFYHGGTKITLDNPAPLDL